VCIADGAFVECDDLGQLCRAPVFDAVDAFIKIGGKAAIAVVVIIIICRVGTIPEIAQLIGCCIDPLRHKRDACAWFLSIFNTPYFMSSYACDIWGDAWNPSIFNRLLAHMLGLYGEICARREIGCREQVGIIVGKSISVLRHKRDACAWYLSIFNTLYFLSSYACAIWGLKWLKPLA
jgi:hypothetical protein